MTQVGELVNVFAAAVNGDEYCNEKESPATWKARINKWGTNQECSATRLYDCMKKDKAKDQGFLGGPTPFVAKPGTVGFAWELRTCSKERFPLQAHHIIPKNHLPDHGVCAFLAKKYSKNPDYKLTSDTLYDTDHANNGYCMPYATPLREWKRAKNEDDKLAIAYKVMDKTSRQLHQGSHKAGPYEDPPTAEEESGIHTKGPGYLDTVDEFLKRVQSGAKRHVDSCRVCKPDKSKKDTQPLEAVVRHMDQVSGLIKLLADANRIFVSKVAAWHWGSSPKKIKVPDWLEE